MSDFEFLLNKYFDIRQGKRQASEMCEAERKELWSFVDNYIFGLERRLFKTHSAKQHHAEQHQRRIMAFYTFLDYCMKHEKGVRWALTVFRMRFVDLEGLLTISRSGVVSVDELIENGISSTLTRKATRLASARRQCSRKLGRVVRSFDELRPCLHRGSVPTKLLQQWRSYYEYFQELRQVAAPFPLELNEEIARDFGLQ